MCNATGLPALSPNPATTPWGGIDVSNFQCKAEVTSESCCGYVPRFNWILSTCQLDPKNRTTQACQHAGANASRLNVNYLSVYQWDGSGWNIDEASSLASGADLDSMLVGEGPPNEWDLKYGPTTNHTGTNGVGPPAMLFVLSAEEFVWSAFYALNQITVNRGPGGEVMKDNCWSSSSGEFDFVEAPFWAGVVIPTNRLYFTSTANSGRCIPTAKSVPSRYASECNDDQCCLPCNCEFASGAPVCFGSKNDIGYASLGCTQYNATGFLGPGQEVILLGGSNVSCANHSGSIGGGGDSSSYFVQPDTPEPMIYAAVVDGDGMTTYRWRSSQENVWPGISRKYSVSRLTATRPTANVAFGTPCDTLEPCAIHQPACGDDCPLIEAGGKFGLNTPGGPFAVEAAKVGQNWWNLFNSTGQLTGRLTSASQLAFYSPVPRT
jgi:hypothetical protein